MRKGFTLIETLTLIGIIAILATMIILPILTQKKTPTITLVELKTEWAEWEVEDMRDSGKDHQYVWLLRKVGSNIEKKRVRVDEKTFELLRVRWADSRRIRSLTQDVPVEAEKTQ